ncbi:MAG: hypothetical protein E7265_01780 [Lachnospiraceae bacterium]|nr:hypothetical protein [Lachnospiraceae bacterium]
MRFVKKGIAIVLAAAMVITMAPANEADAAKKKPKLNVTKKTIAKGGKLKLKVKNATKKTKVTWKATGKGIVKLAKKKGLNNTVTAVKNGKSTVKATVQVSKKKKVTLKCAVTVKKATPKTTTPATVATPTAPVGNVTNAPVQASATPVAGPDATATVVPTPKATRTPKPTKTPEPTAIPIDDTVTFEAVEGIKIENSTYNRAEGNSKYIEDKDIVEVNDPQNQTHGSWAMPADMTVAVGDVVTFRVQGFFKGTQTVRFWIGTEGNGGCTPIKLVKTVEEGTEIVDWPCCYNADAEDPTQIGEPMVGVSGETTNGAAFRKDQKALNADPETGKFDVTFSLKAGTSQNDVGTDFSRFTIKGIIGNNIDGLVVKNIYITGLNGNPAKPSTPSTEDPTPTEDPYANVQGIDLSGTKAFYGKGTVEYDEESNSFTAKDNAGVSIPLGQTVDADESIKLTIIGTAPTGGFRLWMSNASNPDGPTTAVVMSSDVGILNGKDFVAEYDVTVNAASDTISLKGLPAGSNWDTLIVKKIIVGGEEEPTTPPTDEPSVPPTDEPSVPPTDEPSVPPTDEPSVPPTDAPSEAPTDEPSEAPTDEPLAPEPTASEPTAPPTDAPSEAPTDAPSEAPTDEPSVPPTDEPTAAPTDEPTAAPTDEPTAAPTDEPTAAPTDEPTTPPTEEPGYEVNLAGVKNYDGNGSVAYADGVITATGVKGILIPIVGTFAKDDKVSVTVEGESSGAVRSWLVKVSGNGDQLSTAVVNPITFGQAYELTFGEDFENPYLHIKVPAYDSPALDNLTITSVVVE